MGPLEFRDIVSPNVQTLVFSYKGKGKENLDLNENLNQEPRLVLLGSFGC